MNRYFIEVAYMGTGFAGFQVQENARTIQDELERAMEVLFREKVVLTGSSRTDTGVHARQNFFHFDWEKALGQREEYSLNAMLPDGIAVRAIRQVKEGAHCRFGALWREYRYLVYGRKDPFLRERGYYFPFKTDVSMMQEAAELVKEYCNFAAFAKRNSQVKTFDCQVEVSEWEACEGYLVYRVRSNRFLRGMVRGLVGTMLQVGRQKISVGAFRKIIEGGEQSGVDFSVPGRGLCLEEVSFPESYFV